MIHSYEESNEVHHILTPEEFKEQRVNEFMSGTADQLKRAKMHARSHPVQLAFRETAKNHILGPGIPEWHLICEENGQSIIRLYSNSQPFNVRCWEIEDALVRHMYICHEEKVRSDGK